MNPAHSNLIKISLILHKCLKNEKFPIGESLKRIDEIYQVNNLFYFILFILFLKFEN